MSYQCQVNLTDVEIEHLIHAMKRVDGYYGPHEQFQSRHERILEKLKAARRTA